MWWFPPPLSGTRGVILESPCLAPQPHLPQPPKRLLDLPPSRSTSQSSIQIFVRQTTARASSLALPDGTVVAVRGRGVALHTGAFGTAGGVGDNCSALQGK